MPPKENKEQKPASSWTDGVENESGAAVSIASAFYLALIPLIKMVTKEGSFVQTAVQTTIRAVPGMNIESTVGMNRQIPALAALYIFVAFGATGAISAAGQAMARKEGLDSNHPRQHLSALRGLPLRLNSMHLNLMENFPAFALAASLAQSVSPANQQLVNMLGLHVLVKSVVYPVAYLFEISPLRGLCHISANAACIGVCWELAKGL